MKKLLCLLAIAILMMSRNAYAAVNAEIQVEKVIYRQDLCTLIEYPQILGLDDSDKWNKVNLQLKNLFTEGYEANLNGNGYTEFINIAFEIEKNKDLLIIKKTG
jgi:hypothetical protein